MYSDNNKEIVATLNLALRYLEHPDVRAIPFALHVDAVIQRVRGVLKKLQDTKTKTGGHECSPERRNHGQTH